MFDLVEEAVFFFYSNALILNITSVLPRRQAIAASFEMCPPTKNKMPHREIANSAYLYTKLKFHNFGPDYR